MIISTEKKIKFPLITGHIEVQKSRDEPQDTKSLKAKGKFMLSSASEAHPSIPHCRCMHSVSFSPAGRKGMQETAHCGTKSFYLTFL